jgi:hypothetical protein
VTTASQAAKLGLRPGQRVHLYDPAPGWAFDDPPSDLVDADTDGPADLIIAFFTTSGDIAARLDGLARRIFPAGALWVAWPRRAGGHRSDITDTIVREQALPIGLVDVKVAAIDNDWSGLRLVWRVVNRSLSRTGRGYPVRRTIPVWVFIDAEGLRFPPWRSRSRSNWPTSLSTGSRAPRFR